MCYATDLFQSIPKPDLFLFNVLFRGFSSNDFPRSSILLFSHLRKNTHLKPDDRFTYSFKVSAASIYFDNRVAFMLHGQAIVDGYASDLFVGSALVEVYFKFSHVEYARRVFDKLNGRDTVLCNTIVSGLVKNSCFEDSILVFRDVLRSGGNWLDSTSVAAVLPAAAELQELKLGMEIQCLGLKLGFHDHVHVLTGLVSLYSKCGEIGKAELLFREIERPDLISCNAMISGYTCNGETESSIMLFKELLVSGEKVNSSTIVGLIPVFYPFGHLCLTDCIHCFFVKSGIVSHSSVSTALTTVNSRLNEIEAERQLFYESPEKSLAAWNAMIARYTQNGLTEKAVSLFQEMQTSKVIPNPVTVTTILSACAQRGALSMDKWVHRLAKSRNFVSNICVNCSN